MKISIYTIVYHDIEIVSQLYVYIYIYILSYPNTAIF